MRSLSLPVAALLVVACTPPATYVENFAGSSAPKLKYSGAMRDGKFEGHGRLETFWPNGKIGTVYEGEFRAGELVGQGLKLQFDPEGRQLSRHEGLFINSFANGQGTYYGEAGLPLDRGVFVEGRLHGVGERWSYLNREVTEHYIGLFVDGEYSGAGEITFFRASKRLWSFRGEFRDGKPAQGLTTYYQDGAYRCEVPGPPAKVAECPDGSSRF